VLGNEREAVMAFITSLPIRKVSARRTKLYDANFPSVFSELKKRTFAIVFGKPVLWCGLRLEASLVNTTFII
jgi:hypothetical protein